MDVSAAWDRYTTNIHARAAAANAPALPAARRPPPAADSNAVKLVTELKPDTLSHDASAGELRIWCCTYEAYFPPQYAASTQPSSTGLPVEVSGFRTIVASDKHDHSYHARVGSRRVVVPYYASEHILSEISFAAEKEDVLPQGTTVRSESIKSF